MSIKSAPYSFDLHIMIEDESWTGRHPDIEMQIENAVHKIFEYLYLNSLFNFQDFELSLLLTNDTAIRDLNKAHRGKDKPTNVLSFPMQEWDEDDPFYTPVFQLGDIALALETLERESKEQNKSFQHHCIHMLTHGILHLLGYDHEHDTEAEEMESLEIQILQTMHIKNPYADVENVA